MKTYASKEYVVSAVRWNALDGKKSPDLAWECNDSDLVEPVTYSDLSNILGTSGCSKNDPWWMWQVMGKITLDHGVLIVCPGDWIVKDHHGNINVYTDEMFNKFFYTDKDVS
jgi:hypothetical protein